MLAGTPSSVAAGSFSPIERPPSHAFPAKYQPPILPPNFPRNPPPYGQPSMSSDPSVNGQPFTSHMLPTRPPLSGPTIQHPFLSQPSIPPGPPANSQLSASHMPPTHPPLNGSAVPYPPLSQPSMGPNGMSTSLTYLHEKHTNIYLFQVNRQRNLCIQTPGYHHRYLIKCILHPSQTIHCNPLSPINR